MNAVEANAKRRPKTRSDRALAVRTPMTLCAVAVAVAIAAPTAKQPGRRGRYAGADKGQKQSDPSAMTTRKLYWTR